MLLQLFKKRYIDLQAARSLYALQARLELDRKTAFAIGTRQGESAFWYNVLQDLNRHFKLATISRVTLSEAELL